MRKSVKKDDKGYDPYAAGNYEVWLNGLKVDGCFTAVEESGEVWIYVEDNEGRFVLDLEKNVIKAKCLKGKVEIKGSKNGK